jgi:hypothetical protein
MKHASFRASVPGQQQVSEYQTGGKTRFYHNMQCAQCKELGRSTECVGSDKSGCLPCSKTGIDGCTHKTAFRMWNATVSALDLSSTEVGYLIDRYIAKGEVSSDEGKSDGGGQSGRSQGSGVSGTGEVEEKSGMGIDEGDQTTVGEMKSMLEEKDKEIHSLREQLRSWGSLDELRKCLEETKGQFGWDKIRKLEEKWREQENKIKKKEEKILDYQHFFDKLKQQSVERLMTSEKVIQALDEFIKYPHPDRPKFEDDEIRVVRERFASSWKTDCQQVAAWFLGHNRHPIILPNYELGDGCYSRTDD